MRNQTHLIGYPELISQYLSQLTTALALICLQRILSVEVLQTGGSGQPVELLSY